MDAVSSLLPAIQFFEQPSSSQTRNQSAFQSRHCDDPDCFISAPAMPLNIWDALDAMESSEDDDEYGYGAVRPFHALIDSRRQKRATELKTRAKARLMPTIDLCQPRRGRHSRQRGIGGMESDGPRTPSPPPMRTRLTLYQRETLSQSPKTPTRGRHLARSSSRTPVMGTPTGALTPASTVTYSPPRTPLLPSRFQSPSP